MQLGLRFGSVLHPAALGEAAHQIFDQGGKFLEVAPAPAFGFTGETGHALGHVGLKADALLFAVVADVDAGLNLLGDDLAHGAIHLSGEFGARRGAFLPRGQSASQRAFRCVEGFRRGW